MRTMSQSIRTDSQDTKKAGCLARPAFYIFL